MTGGATSSIFLNNFWAAVGLGAGTGALNAAVNGGNILKGALIGGVSGAAFYGVGKYFKGLSDAGCSVGSAGGRVYEFGGNSLTANQIAGQITAHATVGGVLSVVQGGKFGSGFISAGVTKGLTDSALGAAGNLDTAAGIIRGTVTSAIIGGTASALSGGKFANGANTAAFQFLFNAVATAAAAQNRSYASNDPNYHSYDVESAICQVDSVCTMDSVSTANRMHPAPGMLSNKTPVVDGQISNAQIGYDGGFDDFGQVVHSVSSDGLTVRNTTLEGHKLYPGYVERTVFQRDNTIYIRTFGEGVGPMRAANEFFAKPLWNGLVDGHVRYEVNLGYRK